MEAVIVCLEQVAGLEVELSAWLLATILADGETAAVLALEAVDRLLLLLLPTVDEKGLLLLPVELAWDV
jgi:hypothetical protein